MTVETNQGVLNVNVGVKPELSYERMRLSAGMELRARLEDERESEMIGRDGAAAHRSENLKGDRWRRVGVSPDEGIVGECVRVWELGEKRTGI